MKLGLCVTSAAMALAAMTWGSSAAADTILFNNFGPGDAYDTGVGWAIGASEDWQSGPGFVMESGGDYWLTSITASLRHVAGGNFVTLSVYDSVGGVPGNLLETSSAMNLPPHDGTEAPPTVFAFSGSTALLDGETYWVIASTDGLGGAWLAWNWNSIDGSGLHGQRQGNDGAWQSFANFEQGVMRVQGLLIPAPGALALLGLGLIRSRRRRY